MKVQLEVDKDLERRLDA